jgi:Integrase core domain
VKLNCTAPGKPTQNAFIESFNGKFRNECLNEHWFASLNEARLLIERWRQEYNQIRRHSSFGRRPQIYLPPNSKNINLQPESSRSTRPKCRGGGGQQKSITGRKSGSVKTVSTSHSEASPYCSASNLMLVTIVKEI